MTEIYLHIVARTVMQQAGEATHSQKVNPVQADADAAAAAGAALQQQREEEELQEEIVAAKVRSV